MKRKVELPLLEPLYSTYHYQGIATAAVTKNPTIRNWYLNKAAVLSCNLKFLNGYTTPGITVLLSSWDDTGNFEKRWYPMEFLRGHTNTVIRNLIDSGYYVVFGGVDDYYVKGKSWYKERHFSHDGIICGYDQEEKTYCIYAYDSNWIFQKFWTPQSSFEAGRKIMFKDGKYGFICGIKPKMVNIEFSVGMALNAIKEYMDSCIKKQPDKNEDRVYGIDVHDYIAKYVGKLYDGTIPYERMDRRVFRLIWEHKKVMYERICCIESHLNLQNRISEKYKTIVEQADNMRMLYASHHMRRRDSILPIIQKKLLLLKIEEEKLLKELLDTTKGVENL